MAVLPHFRIIISMSIHFLSYVDWMLAGSYIQCGLCLSARELRG